MATANKDVDTTRIVFNPCKRRLHTIGKQRFLQGFGLVLTLGFDAAKVDIDKAVVVLIVPDMRFLFMFFMLL